MKLKYCYHTHTNRCGHASGEDEDYIINAINKGFLRYGVSDHIFLPGIHQQRVRGDFSSLEEYLATFHKIRDKYKDKISIVIGFEAEYLPSYEKYYRTLLDDKLIDYLILGQHYHEVNGELHLFTPENYAEDVVKALDTGLFTYVAHPDIFLLAKNVWDEANIAVARKILGACAKKHIPIEINACGLRSHRPYPSKDFFRLSKEYDVEYVIGVDAHSPTHFEDGYIEEALQFAEELGLEIKDLVI